MSALLPNVERRMMRELARRDIRPMPSAQAPGSLADLLGILSKDHAHGHGLLAPFSVHLPVFNGGAGQTIWSGPAANYAFRALHDLDHFATRADFTLEGETRVYHQALRWARTPLERDALWWEIVGQVEWHSVMYEFPENQREFVLAGLRSRGYTLP